MGVASSVHDTLSNLSPWTTSISVDNQTNAPVIVWLAHHAENPSASDAEEHEIPANTITGISSGWLNVPKATLLVRTGVDSAQVIRAPHATRLVIKVVPHGLAVESLDSGVEFEDFSDPGAVPGHDTVAMVLRNEHFRDRAPNAETRHQSVAQEASGRHHSAVSVGSVHDTLSNLSPWTTSISVDNQTNAPVIAWLARSAEHPTPDDAVQHVFPANTVTGLSSGWFNVPKATLLIRTGLDSAQVIRAPHATRLVIKVVPHGLKVESLDSEVEFEDFSDPGAVPGHDTIPMALRNEHFHDRPAHAESRHQSVASEAVKSGHPFEKAVPQSPAPAGGA